MRTLGRYVKPFIGRISLQMFIKISGTVFELLLPSLLSAMLDDYAPVNDWRGVWLMGGAMILCTLLAWCCNICANRMATTVSRQITRSYRRDLFRKMTSLSAAQQDRLTDATLVSRLTSDTYNVHNMIDRMQRLGVRAPIMLLGGICVALTLDWALTLVLIAALPILATVITISSKKGVPLFTRVTEAQDKMVRRIQENMSGARVIRALSRSEHERESFAGVCDHLAATQRKADLTMAAVSPIVNLVLNIGLAGVVLVGALRVQALQAQPGSIIAFLSYFTIILNSLLMVSRLFVLYSKGAASAHRLEEVMNQPVDLQRVDGPRQETDAYIEFRGVTFSYNKTTPNLADISFTLRHGETLGIIGPTGSGKSTLLALLLRQYDPDEGQIFLDGAPLNSLTKEELYARVGVVFQNDFLMADTLRENISFGRNVSDDSIREAMVSAQAAFIDHKPGGLDFELNVRGRNLSGGQQQRVLITRSLANDPRLLLLDDCSSALDFRTDRALRRALRSRFGSATTIMVAQRVSAVMAADHILVMDGGRIVGAGKHAELMKTCPMYQNLCRLQLGGDAV